MPYIDLRDRPQYQEAINTVVDRMVRVSTHSNNIAKGHLNYIITAIVRRFLKRTGMNYANAQDFIGTLECCKLELYRRLLAEVEDEKIEQNGDVE